MGKQNCFVLVLSIDDDSSTTEVVEWLLNFKQRVLRVDDSIFNMLSDVEINNKGSLINFKIGKHKVNTKQIKSFWFRKGGIPIIHQSDLSRSSYLNWYLTQEKKALYNFIALTLNEKARINTIGKGDVNKLLQLSVAVTCGLNIPHTLITNNKLKLITFKKTKRNIVTKSIQVLYANKESGLHTSKFESKDIDALNEVFFFTKFQTEIKKQYELRVFFLNRTYYSMAIFSQNNTKTKIDFRNYDKEKPNRMVPYNLPSHIKTKLTKFMNQLQLKSGSIDMIVDINNNYYFLEVNPVGQFGMVSKTCNYYLEEKIAKQLAKVKNE